MQNMDVLFLAYTLMRIFTTQRRNSEKSVVRFQAFKNFTIMFSNTVLFIALLIRWLFQNLGYWDSNDKSNRSLLTCLDVFLFLFGTSLLFHRLFLSFPHGERGQAGGSKLSGKTSLPWTCWLSTSVGCPHWLTSVAMVASWLWWWQSCSDCFSSSFCFRQIWWSLWSTSSSSS